MGIGIRVLQKLDPLDLFKKSRILTVFNPDDFSHLGFFPSLFVRRPSVRLSVRLSVRPSVRLFFKTYLLLQF